MKYKRLADDQIGYVYYGSFSSGVGENNLDYMFAHFKECKGLIFDVRDNGVVPCSIPTASPRVSLRKGF